MSEEVIKRTVESLQQEFIENHTVVDKLLADLSAARAAYEKNRNTTAYLLLVSTNETLTIAYKRAGQILKVLIKEGLAAGETTIFLAAMQASLEHVESCAYAAEVTTAYFMGQASDLEAQQAAIAADAKRKILQVLHYNLILEIEEEAAAKMV